MSGGRFNYGFIRIESLIEDMKNWLKDSQDKPIPEDIRKGIGVYVERLRVDAALARSIEYYASGDDGDDAMRKVFAEYMGQGNDDVANPR